MYPITINQHFEGREPIWATLFYFEAHGIDGFYLA